MKQYETIDGFDIPSRELTEEEANREITLKRFQEWHIEVGEDFIDTHFYGDAKVFLGFAIAKYPEHSKELLNLYNKEKSFSHIQSIQQLLEDIWNDESGDRFYTLYADFLNHTEHSKKNVNRQLILVMEHYSHE